MKLNIIEHKKGKKDKINNDVKPINKFKLPPGKIPDIQKLIIRKQKNES